MAGCCGLTWQAKVWGGKWQPYIKGIWLKTRRRRHLSWVAHHVPSESTQFLPLRCHRKESLFTWEGKYDCKSLSIKWFIPPIFRWGKYAQMRSTWIHFPEGPYRFPIREQGAKGKSWLGLNPNVNAWEFFWHFHESVWKSSYGILLYVLGRSPKIRIFCVFGFMCAFLYVCSGVLHVCEYRKKTSGLFPQTFFFLFSSPRDRISPTEY